MPTLKQIKCSIELGSTAIRLKEYGTTYGDGVVKTYVAVPDADIPFIIHIQTDGYVAPGLAFFVFMDGEYQCNRHRAGFSLPSESTERGDYEIDFRLTQKEEKKRDGEYVVREWTFSKLKKVSDNDAPSLNRQFLKNVGTIEVVALRCKAPDPLPDTEEARRFYSLPQVDGPANTAVDGRVRFNCGFQQMGHGVYEPQQQNPKKLHGGKCDAEFVRNWGGPPPTGYAASEANEKKSEYEKLCDEGICNPNFTSRGAGKTRRVYSSVSSEFPAVRPKQQQAGYDPGILHGPQWIDHGHEKQGYGQFEQGPQMIHAGYAAPLPGQMDAYGQYQWPQPNYGQYAWPPQPAPAFQQGMYPGVPPNTAAWAAPAVQMQPINPVWNAAAPQQNYPAPQQNPDWQQNQAAQNKQSTQKNNSGWGGGDAQNGRTNWSNPDPQQNNAPKNWSLGKNDPNAQKSWGNGNGNSKQQNTGNTGGRGGGNADWGNNGGNDKKSDRNNWDKNTQSSKKSSSQNWGNGGGGGWSQQGSGAVKASQNKDAWNNSGSQKKGDDGWGDAANSGNNNAGGWDNSGVAQNNDNAWANGGGSQKGNNNDANWGGGGADNNQWENKSKKASSLSSRSEGRSYASSNTCYSASTRTSLTSLPTKPSPKPYWQTWRTPFNKLSESDTNTITGRPPLKDAYIYPSEPLPAVPGNRIAKDVAHAIQTGKGKDYAHPCRHPEYIDTMDAPYAVFTFKYRSKEVLEEMLKIKIDDSRVERARKGAEREMLLGMPKHLLVRELMEKRGPSNSVRKEELRKAASTRDTGSQKGAVAEAKSGWGGASQKDAVQNATGGWDADPPKQEAPAKGAEKTDFW